MAKYTGRSFYQKDEDPKKPSSPTLPPLGKPLALVAALLAAILILVLIMHRCSERKTAPAVSGMPLEKALKTGVAAVKKQEQPQIRIKKKTTAPHEAKDQKKNTSAAELKSYSKPVEGAALPKQQKKGPADYGTKLEFVVPDK